VSRLSRLLREMSPRDVIWVPRSAAFGTPRIWRGGNIHAGQRRLGERVVPQMASQWYHCRMAMNLRLSSEAADAVRREAQRTGRSQQEVIRDAIASHLGLGAGEGSRDELGSLVSTGTVRPPRAWNRQGAKRLTLPSGVTSADLLDRGDRI
jgi:hypothetical protein